MLTCQFCGLTGTPEDGDFQLDTLYNRGFFCECCDGFTYFDDVEEKHRFILILEHKNKRQEKISTPIKFHKRLSPYRYPGGKSRIIDYLYTYLQKEKTKKLVSPFTGGASFELAMLHSGVVEELHLNDLDFGVYSFWWLVKHMPYALIERIQTVRPTHNDYFSAQELIKSDYHEADMVDAAWSSLLVNRLSYSGIYKANPLGGKNGSINSLLLRWNPDELIKRIHMIHELTEKITITQLDACELIEEAYWEDQATIFIDPPYVDKGKDLYHCYYTKRDHINLAVLLDTLYRGSPGSDIIVTYDYSEWLENLYDYPQIVILNRNYSI